METKWNKSFSLSTTKELFEEKSCAYCRLKVDGAVKVGSKELYF